MDANYKVSPPGLILCYNNRDGALAQLIERSIRIAEVAGLIPARSTTVGAEQKRELALDFLCYN